MAELEFWFLELIQIAIQAIKQMVDMLFRMLFNMGEFGKIMKEIMKACCMLLNLILWIWNNTICLIFQTVLVPMIKSLAYLISSIISFFKGDRGIVNFMWTIVHYMEMVTCDYKLDCAMEIKVKNSIEFGALPVASRCWADFSPEMDVSDSFACTRSDTCRYAPLTSRCPGDRIGAHFVLKNIPVRHLAINSVAVFCKKV